MHARTKLAILLAAGTLGAVAILSKGGPKAVTYPPAKITDFSSVHFPTLIVEAAFSNATMDGPFLDMLQQLGLDSVTVHTSPSYLNFYLSRYTAVVSGIRARGMRVRFVVQDEPTFTAAFTGVPPTYPSPPTQSQYISTEGTAISTIQSSFQPENISVVAEPQTLEGRIGTTFTVDQWTQIVQALSQLTPNAWLAVNEQSAKELQVAQNALQIPTVKGIGIDQYNHTELFNTSALLAEAAIAQGKLAGLTETWWEDIFAHPQYDSPSNATYEAQWLSSTGINFVDTHGILGLFNPFFSSKFVTLAHLPSLTDPSTFTTFNQALGNALAASQRTITFTAYQSAIAANRALL